MISAYSLIALHCLETIPFVTSCAPETKKHSSLIIQDVHKMITSDISNININIAKANDEYDISQATTAYTGQTFWQRAARQLYLHSS